MTVVRDGGLCEVSDTELIPGDVVDMADEQLRDTIMKFDGCLLLGSCVMDESMLTGECVPVTKTPLPFTSDTCVLYSPLAHHAQHSLHCGTRIVQVHDDRLRIVVTRTAFATVKGHQIRSIMYPKPISRQYSRDLGIMFLILGVLALAAMIYTIAVFILSHASAKRIIIR